MPFSEATAAAVTLVSGLHFNIGVCHLFGRLSPAKAALHSSSRNLNEAQGILFFVMKHKMTQKTINSIIPPLKFHACSYGRLLPRSAPYQK